METVQESSIGPCRLWQGALSTEGYGRFRDGTRLVQAHRYGWELKHGPIPEGMELDHLCHTEAVQRGECLTGPCPHRACTNVDHLELVTHAENVRRGRSAIKGVKDATPPKTHCPAGHPFDGDNVRVDRFGQRCRTCERLRKRAARGTTPDRFRVE